MSYGISIENASGYIQIDSGFTNYVLVSSGTVNATAGVIGTYSGIDPGTATINGLQADDIVAVRGTDICQAGRSASAQSLYNFTTSAQTISYRVYRKASDITPSTSDYGLEVFDESGNLRFSSKYAPAKVLATYNTYNGFSTVANGAWACLFGTGLRSIIPAEEDGGFIAGEEEYFTVTASSSGHNVGTEFIDFYDTTTTFDIPVGAQKNFLFLKD
jgi:hypothetical protein